MQATAAHAIANVITEDELTIPGVFNAAVAEAVAREVKKAAIRTGVGREKLATHGKTEIKEKGKLQKI